MDNLKDVDHNKFRFSQVLDSILHFHINEGGALENIKLNKSRRNDLISFRLFSVLAVVTTAIDFFILVACYNNRQSAINASLNFYSFYCITWLNNINILGETI